MLDGCVQEDTHEGSCHFHKGLASTVNITLESTPDTEMTLQTYSSSAFFFCFTYDLDAATGAVVCGSYGPFFTIEASSPSTSLTMIQRQEGIGSFASSADSESSLFTNQIAATALPAATTVISLVSSTPILSAAGSSTTVISASSASVPPISTSYAATVTTLNLPPTGTDGSAIATNTSSSSSSSTSKSSGLSLSAKVGIALGVIIVVFLILLAILLLLRLRRRRKNTPPSPSRTPENLLLASSLKNNDSRDLFAAEKLGHTDRADTNTPLTSRGAGIGGGVFDHDDDLTADLPAPGSAFTANTPVPISPRRSLAANTLRSEVLGMGMGMRGRGVSMTSGVSPVLGGGSGSGSGEGRGINGGLSREVSRERIGERSIFDEGSYMDDLGVASGMGVGGRNENGNGNDVRGNLDVPKVSKGTLQAPFLSEPGMSPEEVARLEEEERRIDEAIAEAEAEEERRRAREAGGRGR